MSLKSIFLRDFVIVHALELDLSKGFTVLTGETGAGKSILIDALQLALGARADAAMVREGAQRCEISATFDCPASLAGWLDDLGASVTAFAAHIGISRVMLSRVLHGHAAVSADMDLRLSEALGTTPGYWLALQTQCDLWTARQTAKDRKRIKLMAAPESVAA